MTDHSQEQLADARRLKKRELDRKAQRVARERNKNRIAHLENMVQRLRRDDADSQIPDLMDQLAGVTEERDQHLQVLRGLGTTIGRYVNKTITSDAGPSDNRIEDITSSDVQSLSYLQTDSPFDKSIKELSSEPGDIPSSTYQQPLLDPAASLARPENTWNYAAESSVSFGISSDPSVLETPIYTTEGMATSSMPALPTIPLDETGIHIPPAPNAPDPSMFLESDSWRKANEALGRSSAKMLHDEIVKNDAEKQDTLVLAVLKGWDNVEESGKMTDAWQRLRVVDEACFRPSGKVERLAALRMMHQLIMYHGDPSLERHSDLPRWLWMRPSQTITHSRAIDFIAWPGLRERFIFSERRYSTVLFWTLFRSGFKILWPYDFRDTYLCNVETGKYEISPLFAERISNINTWTMPSEFFVHFPELYEDIPVYMSIPARVPATDEEMAVHSTSRELMRRKFEGGG